MVPTPEFNMNAQVEDHEEQSSIAKIKDFQHSRNMTGVVGDSQWHTDIKVNDLWDKLSVPESCGKFFFKLMLSFTIILGVEDLQKSVVYHVINTLARTHFNCDDFAGYQAAAHRYFSVLMNFIMNHLFFHLVFVIV